MVRLSLVIPTYQRAADAERCLLSVQRQTLPDFEVLLVDNSPDATLRSRIDALNAAARVPARYVHEPRLGLHNARHAGARAASGDVVIFTDDDAEFDPGWLAAYAGCFEAHPEMAAAGGRVLPTWEARPPAWLCAAIQRDPNMFPALSLLDLSPEFRLSADGIFFGVNMAVRRDVLFAAGGFNPEIFGDRWLGDGETGLNRKLWSRGELVGYVPDALVYHRVSRERMTVAYLRRRQTHEGACDMYARFHPHMPARGALARACIGIVKESARDWLAEPLFRGRTDPRALRVQLRAVRAWSRLEYVVRLMFDPRLRALVARETWL
ncbi:MAG: glycosyltransferase family 2 protein [Chloroflexi bacterium]|nr:glycosyltransferase family 2 protein [Chloroflexota bacterium]